MKAENRHKPVSTLYARCDCECGWESNLHSGPKCRSAARDEWERHVLNCGDYPVVVAENERRERRSKFVKLRDSGMNWADIGREMGVTGGRAKEAYLAEVRKMKREAEGISLSVRTETAIRNFFGFKPPFSDDEVFEAERRLIELRHLPNFGRKCAKELEAFSQYRRNKA